MCERRAQRDVSGCECHAQRAVSRHERTDPGLPPQLRSCRVPPKAVYRGTRNLGKPAFVFEESRSEGHTSELQSLMRISYAAFWLKTQQTYQLNFAYKITH